MNAVPFLKLNTVPLDRIIRALVGAGMLVAPSLLSFPAWSVALLAALGSIQFFVAGTGYCLLYDLLRWYPGQENTG